MIFFRKQKKVIYFWFVLFFLVSCGGGSSLPDPSPTLTAEAGEELSGGATTVFATTDKAFSFPAANLTAIQEGAFKSGNSFFEGVWVEAPGSTTARDGLGPLFLAKSCAGCHVKDGRGSPPNDPDEIPIDLLFRLSIPGEGIDGGPLPDPHYGGQLDVQAINAVVPEANVQVDYEEIKGQYADGESYSLRHPTYTIHNLGYGPFHESLMISPRIAPQMPGMGLLEAIAEEDILANEDPEDKNGDSISGRANFVWDVENQVTVLGRFGWKANQPNIRQQVAAAFLGDIGITSPIFPEQNCTATQTKCLEAIEGGNPEIEEKIFNNVVFYTQTLGIPARRQWEEPEVLRGKQLFNQMGCALCHQAKFQTSEDFPIAELANQTIRPYSDLLLHDMGEGLADHRPDFLADGFEWRTPPLWGIGLIEKVNGHLNLLHDGRARGFAEAILWHGGEAETAKENFRNATKTDREDLIRFLESL